MATYFHGNPSDIQTSPEGLQTLVLMNPTYVQYSDAPPPSSLVFLNSAAGNLSPPPHLPHAPPSSHQFVGVPLDPNSHDASALHGFVPRLRYNLYDHAPPARDPPRAQRELSLSLSSQQQPGNGSISPGSGVTNGGSGLVFSSKYLKAAQELLDEVVSVNDSGLKKGISNGGMVVIGETSGCGEGSAGGGGSDGGGKRAAAELSTVERQEIQMKKAKLINMLDEVEQRYRQYHQQMQIVISSFEQAAGLGSAKTYTSLALQTISKQFRALKDAITAQIKAASKNLGEQDWTAGKLEGSRLKFVDHHLRQQRALQQLGMIQHNAWRPQRGLPERSVSVLRAWLFEHFLHPYPKDSDKIMLAKQTGLTRSQVSNWFINARVRLWKPMVEEMYLEEIKEQDRNGSDEKTMSKGEQNENSGSKSVFQDTGFANDQNTHSSISMSTASTSPAGGNVRNHSGFSLIGSSELEGITQVSPKRPRINEIIQSPSIDTDMKSVETNHDQIVINFGNERQSREGCSFIGGQTNFIGGFGQYPIGDLERFEADQHFSPRFSGNGVSLTLGLPHCENHSFSGTHHNFLQNQNIEQNEFGALNAPTPHSSSTYDSINIQNGKRYAAQLLPDFVA